MESLFQAAVAAQTPSHNPGHESEISETIRSTNPLKKSKDKYKVTNLLVFLVPIR